MPVINNRVEFKDFLRDEVARRAKVKGDPKSQFDLETALNQKLIMDSSEMKQLADEVIAAQIDANQLLARGPLNELETKFKKLVEELVSEVKKDGAGKTAADKDRSSTRRLINEYYLPSLYEARNRSNMALDRVNERLKHEPLNIDLQQYQAALSSQVAHFDSLVALPFALQKFINVLGTNQGRNYTPRENAQVLASLLDTVQKSQEGSWSGEALVKALRVAAKITMPDLPADAITLETIKDLLPYVNNVMEKGKELEQQTANIFPADDEVKSKARKALFETMNIKFESLSDSIKNLVINTLYKPVEDALQATSGAYETFSALTTDDSLDYLKALNFVSQSVGVADEVGNIVASLSGSEAIKGAMDNYHGFTDGVKHRLGQASAIAGQVASAGKQMLGAAGYVMNGLGSAATWMTPNRVKVAVGQVTSKAMSAAESMTDKAVSVARRVAPAAGRVAAAVEYYTPHAVVSRWVPTPVLSAIPMTKQTLLSATQVVADAVAPYIPASIKEKWATQTESSLFWKSLHANGEKEAKKVALYLAFNDLSSASASTGFEEDFFNSYMSTHNADGVIPVNYSEYVALKGLISPEIANIPLSQQMSLLEGSASEGERFNTAASVVHRLNNLEKLCGELSWVEPSLSEIEEASHLKSSHPKQVELRRKEQEITQLRSTLSELQEALQMQSPDPKLAALQHLYVKPALEKGITAIELKLFGPLLEKALDLDSENTNLRNIYSKLKAGQILSEADLNHLKEFSSTSTDIKFNIPEKIEEITREVGPVDLAAGAKAFTPKEQSRQTIQTSLDTLAVLNRAVAEGLQKQLDACEKLKACADGPLKSMCNAKIKYLEVLQKCNNALLEEMKPGGKLAEQIRSIVNGEITSDVLKMPDAVAMAKQLMAATWEVALPKDAMVGAGLQERLLAYALSNNEYMGGLVEAKREFQQALQDNPPPPEFMTQLGNPLSSSLVLTEDLAHKAAATAVNTGIWLGQTAAYYVSRGVLSYLYPPALLAEITSEVLSYPSVKEKIANLVAPVSNLFSPITSRITAPFTRFMNEKQQNLTESVKDYICPMLNIEVKKVLERKAFEYASADSAARSKMGKNERDAFSGFYLQYRAIKKDNPALDKAEFVKQFFKGYLEGKEPAAQEEIIQKVSDEFERLDVSLRLRDQTNTDGLRSTADLERELQFLMSTIDFNAPDEAALVTLTLYNRLMMMQLEAAKQLAPKEAWELQQKAMSTIDSVLQRLEAADAANTSILDEPRTQARAEAIAPATKLAYQIKLNELQQQLAAVSTLVGSGIKDRDEQLKADATKSEPARLGLTGAQEQFNKATKTNLVYKIGSSIARATTPLAFWGTLGLAIATKGALPAVLTAFGVAGAATAGVLTGGLAVVGALVAARVAYTTAKEVRARDSEFRKINESDASPLKKFGLKALTGLKCFGIGLAKAVLLDTVFAKVSSFFSRGVKPIIDEVKNVRDLARSNPTRDVLDTEKAALDGIQTKLKELKGLVDAQVKDKEALGYDATKPDPSKFKKQSSYEKSVEMHKAVDERAEKIEQLARELAMDLDAVQAFLKQSSGDDSRWSGGVYKELDDYKVEFKKLNDLMGQVNLINKTELKMRPEILVQEKIAIENAEKAKEHAVQAAELAKGFHGTRGIELLRALKERGSAAEMKAMAGDIQAIVDSIVEKEKEVVEFAKLAEKAAKDSGEVGVSAMTSINGPASRARDEAQQAVKYVENLRIGAQQFMVGLALDKEIAKQERIELEKLDDRLFEEMKDDRLFAEMEQEDDLEDDLSEDGALLDEHLEASDAQELREEGGAAEHQTVSVGPKRLPSDTSSDSGFAEERPNSSLSDIDADDSDNEFEDAVEQQVPKGISRQFKGKLQAAIHHDDDAAFFDVESEVPKDDTVQPK